MLTRPPAWVWRLAALLLLCAPSARAEVPGGPIRLVYRAPDACPSAVEFLAEVRQAAPLLETVSGEGPGRVFTVTLAGDAGGAVRAGKLRVEKDGALVGSRDVVGSSCEEVARVLAFAVALAYDPGVLVALSQTLPAQETLATPPPEPPPRSVVRGPVPLVPPRRSMPSVTGKLWWGLSGHATVASDLSPNPTFGGGLSAEVGSRSPTFVPYVRLGATYSASAPESLDHARVAFANALVVLEGCVARRLGASFTLGLCARGWRSAHRDGRRHHGRPLPHKAVARARPCAPRSGARRRAPVRRR